MKEGLFLHYTSFRFIVDSIAVSLFSNPNYSETSKLVYFIEVQEKDLHVLVSKILHTADTVTGESKFDQMVNSNLMANSN